MTNGPWSPLTNLSLVTLAMAEAAKHASEALVTEIKPPPIKPVVAPADLIGGLPIRGWGASRIGSRFRMHRFLDARAVA